MVLSMERWEDKVAIVTGASSGIGAAVAEQLVECGLKVVGVARRVENVEELAKKVQGKKGKLYPHKADFSKEEDIIETFKWVSYSVGPVHILINNAGVSKEFDLHEGEKESLTLLLNLNVLGLIMATREAVKIMKQHKINGHIINMNSILGHGIPPIPKAGLYPATKYAVTAITETLRQELARVGTKIRVTSISPGVVETEMTKFNKNNSKERAAFWDLAPSLKSEDIADAIIYSLSTPDHVQVHELTIKPVGEPM